MVMGGDVLLSFYRVGIKTARKNTRRSQHKQRLSLGAEDLQNRGEVVVQLLFAQQTMT